MSFPPWPMVVLVGLNIIRNSLFSLPSLGEVAAMTLEQDRKSYSWRNRSRTIIVCFHGMVYE